MPSENISNPTKIFSRFKKFADREGPGPGIPDPSFIPVFPDMLGKRTGKRDRVPIPFQSLLKSIEWNLNIN